MQSGPSSPSMVDEEKPDVATIRRWAGQLQDGVDDALREAALDAICKHARTLAFDQNGCRVVQTALETPNEQVKTQIARSFQNRVIHAIRSKHANFVLQKIIQEVSPIKIVFLIDEILPEAHECARHVYGCRIFVRLIEYAFSEEESCPIKPLIDFLTQPEELSDLIEDKYGCHIIQPLLEQGSPEIRCRIAAAVQGNMFHLSTHEHGSFIVKKILDDPLLRDPLVAELLADKKAIPSLLRCGPGRHIVNKMKGFSEEVRKETEGRKPPPVRKQGEGATQRQRIKQRENIGGFNANTKGMAVAPFSGQWQHLYHPSMGFCYVPPWPVPMLGYSSEQPFTATFLPSGETSMQGCYGYQSAQ